MAYAIAVINQKGGVGKSTTALALSAGLMIRGYRTLNVDLDAQGNLSYVLNSSPDASSVLDAMTGQVHPDDAIQQLEQGHLLASSPQLSAADMLFTSTGKEYRLRELLEKYDDRYDYIIIDTPPALGILTINALTAAKGIIIPAQAEIYSLQGIGQLYSTIDAVKRYTNPALEIIGILLTRYSVRSVLGRDMAEMFEETAEEMGTVLFKTRIREAVAVREAQARRSSIYDYAPKSSVSESYLELVDTVLEMLKSELPPTLKGRGFS
jgi:ATPases involved in chromosome partitioning